MSSLVEVELPSENLDINNSSDSEEERYVRRMSTPLLTSEMQLRYILQWFEEFSELQKQDFLPILAGKLSSGPHVNGVVSGLHALSCEDKPLSLFQCRIKLFSQWFPNWSEEERNRLIKGIAETDADFNEKLQEELANPGGKNNELDTFPYEYKDAETTENATVNVQSESDDGKVFSESTDNQQLHDIQEVGLSENNIPLEIAANS